MPQTRHRTIIEIGVDDRQIKGLDKTLHRAFDDQLIAGFERVLERTAKTLEQMTKAAERFDTLMRKSGGAGGPAGGGGGGGGTPGSGGGGGAGTDMRALAQAIQGLQRAQQANTQAQPGFMARAGATALGSSVGSYFGGLASNVGQEGFISRAVGGIPVIGGYLSGAINQVQRYYGQHAAGQQSISRTVGGLGRRSVGGPFTQFGLAEPEAMQQAMTMAQGAGLSGADASGDFFRSALNLQMLGGVQGSEGIVRAANVGTGMSFDEPGNQMMQAVSAGIQSGIRESRLGQFVQAATQVLESGRLQGTDLSLAGVLQTMRGVSGLGGGFRGEQGQRATQGIIQTMGTFEAGSDPASLVAMRAVGFGSTRSYHEATRFIQDHPEQALPLIMDEIRGMAPGNEDAQRELMRMLMPRMGLSPTRQQMEALASGDMSGFGAELGTGAAEDFIERRRGEVGGAFATPAVEAAFRNRQLALGGNAAVAGAARGIRNAEMDITESTLVPIATGISEVLDWVNGAVTAFQEDGAEGLMSYFYGEGGLANRAIDALVPGAGRQMAQGANIVQSTGITGAAGAAVDAIVDNYLGGDAPPPPTSTTPTPALAPGVSPPAAEGSAPEASLGHLLRRAADAADRLGLPGEGDLALG